MSVRSAAGGTAAAAPAAARAPAGSRDERLWQAGFLVGSALGAAATVAGRRSRALRADGGLVDWRRVEDRRRSAGLRRAPGALTPAELRATEADYAEAMARVVPALSAALGTELPGVVERVGAWSTGRPGCSANISAFAALIGKLEGELLDQLVPPGSGLAKATMALANRWVTTRQLGLLLGFMGQRVLGQYDLALLSAETDAGPAAVRRGEHPPDGARARRAARAVPDLDRAPRDDPRLRVRGASLAAAVPGRAARAPADALLAGRVARSGGTRSAASGAALRGDGRGDDHHWMERLMSRRAAAAVPRDAGGHEPARGVRRPRHGRGRARPRARRRADLGAGSTTAASGGRRSSGRCSGSPAWTSRWSSTGRARRSSPRSSALAGAAGAAPAVGRARDAAAPEEIDAPTRMASAHRACTAPRGGDRDRAGDRGTGPGLGARGRARGDRPDARSCRRATGPRDLDAIRRPRPGRADRRRLGFDGHPDGPLEDVEVMLRGRLPADTFDRILARAPRPALGPLGDRGRGAGPDPGQSRSGASSITNARGVFSRPIAEYVMLMILAVSRRLPQLLELQRERTWQPLEARELRDVTVGIVGLGSIGRAVGALATAFGCRVSPTRRRPRGGSRGRRRRRRRAVLGTLMLDRVLPPDRLPELLAESDFVVLAAPLTADTQGLIGDAGDRPAQAGRVGDQRRPRRARRRAGAGPRAARGADRRRRPGHVPRRAAARRRRRCTTCPT